ncbi:hypothetical protein D3C73_849030 [compost metagenome]
MGVGMQFVRAGQIARTRHRHGVAVARAAFGDDQVIPAVTLVEMRPFRKTERRALENVGDRPDELLFYRVIFLHHDAAEAGWTSAMIPKQVHVPFAAIVIMKERRIETGRIQIDRIRPRTFNRRRGDHIVMRILERAALALHIRINQPEKAVGIGDAWCPDAAAVGIAAHVELRGPVERPRDQTPVHEIARMMDLYARIPFEGRNGDVIVVAGAADRRVGIEAGQDRVSDYGCHEVILSRSRG